MSASKETHARFGGRGWQRAIRSRRCPVCGGDSWCTWPGDASIVVCMRNVSDIARTAVDGTEYWVHVLNPDARPEYVAGPGANEADVERADVDTLDQAYRMLLSELRLNDAHAANLSQRGLDASEIRARGYRTFPLEGRSAIARRIVERLGETAARGVPGVYVAERDGRTYWTLGGSPGLLIPLLDASGRMVALKVRRDEAGDGPRYTYISSRAHGGARAMLAVHVPRFVGDRTLVRVTEGELKADVATVISSTLTISVPGVGSWQAALPVLREIGATSAIVTFDADHRTKPEVGFAVAALARAVVAAGLELVIERWDAAAGKGIDDVLAARKGAKLVFLQGRVAIGYAAYCEQTATRQRRARQSEAA